MRQTTPGISLVLAASALASAALQVRAAPPEPELSKVGEQPLEREPAYRALAGYLILVVGEEARRIAVAIDRPNASADADVAWVDKNGDGVLEASERVFGAENRAIGGEIIFELGDLDKRFDRVRLTLYGTKKEEIQITGRWDKKHTVWSDSLWGESTRPSRLAATLAEAPVYRAGGRVKIELAASTRLSREGTVVPGGKYEVHALVGFAGFGEGTFLSLATGFVPIATDPIARLKIPLQGAEKDLQVPLVKRCLGNSFRAEIEVPANARPGADVKITLSVPKLDKGQDGAATVKISRAPEGQPKKPEKEPGRERQP